MYNKVREKRKQTRTYIKELRELLGIKTDSGYLKKEAGTTHFTIEEGRKLAQFYNTTLDELFNA